MKYGDLITPNVMNKLMAYSFGRDGVDISIYRFSKSIEEIFGFLDSQRIKIINKYADASASGEILYHSESDKTQCSSDIIAMLDKDVEFTISKIDITDCDFDAENNKRPSSKELWLSPIEIRTILRMSEIMSTE